MHIDPARLDAADRYKLLIGSIVPRPIAWVSTVSPKGELNLAPFSFFCGVGSDPMTLLFCPANKPDGTEKDSLANAKPAAEGGVGEFVVSSVPEALARAMAACAEPLAHGQSEVEMLRSLGVELQMEPSTAVRPPRIAECPVAFECRTVQVIRTNPGRPAGGNIVIGQVVAIHAHEGLVNARYHVDPEGLKSVGRMGGLGYCFTRERFDMPMGKKAILE